MKTVVHLYLIHQLVFVALLHYTVSLKKLFSCVCNHFEIWNHSSQIHQFRAIVVNHVEMTSSGVFGEDNSSHKKETLQRESRDLGPVLIRNSGNLAEVPIFRLKPMKCSCSKELLLNEFVMPEMFWENSGVPSGDSFSVFVTSSRERCTWC